MRSHWLHRLIIFVIAMSGTAMVLTVMVKLNRPPPEKDRTGGRSAVSFAVPEPPKPPPAPRQAPKPRPRPRSAPPPPAPMLAASLNGLSFGLEGLMGAALSDDAGLLGDSGGVVMTAATVDEPPRPVTRTGANYPARARARGLEGIVRLSLLVNIQGTVEDVVVLEGTPPGVFEEAAKAAIRQWRFEPGEYEGRPVPVRVEQLLRFELS